MWALPGLLARRRNTTFRVKAEARKKTRRPSEKGAVDDETIIRQKKPSSDQEGARRERRAAGCARGSPWPTGGTDDQVRAGAPSEDHV